MNKLGPYELNSIIQGDCLEVMPGIPEKSIGMILADLPYQETDCDWDKMIPLEPLWSQYKRIITDRGVIVLTAASPFNYVLYNSNPDWFKYEWVWDKRNISNPLMGWQQPLRKHEYVLVFYKNGATYNPQMTKGGLRDKGGKRYGRIENDTQSGRFNILENHSSVNDEYYPKSIIEISNAAQKGKLHPTQKPVALFSYLIRTYSNPGDLVLDNAAGSCTLAIAAIETGRNWLCIEQSPKYVKIGRGRVEARLKQPFLPGLVETNPEPIQLELT
jgi:site-specific DNA-methyltransferase (adenine-specific)